MSAPVVILARNRLLAFLYEANRPYVLPYLLLASVGWPLVYGSWGWRPELWRAAGGIINPAINTHHTLIIWMLSLLVLALWRVKKFDPLLSVFAAFQVIAVHEITWWVVDWVKLGSAFNPVWLLGGYLYPVATIVSIFYCRVINVPWRLILIGAVFYAAWFAIGFPVTVNWIGRTALYDDPLANWLEIASWVWYIGAFWLTERGRLRVWESGARLSIGIDKRAN